MAHEIDWTKQIVEEFIRIGKLSELEQKIIKTRALLGWTRTKQSQEFHISMSRLDNMISVLKQKYDICQQFSSILPPRRHSKEEDYMDNN